jgi:3-dehydroquinate synthase
MQGFVYRHVPPPFHQYNCSMVSRSVRLALGEQSYDILVCAGAIQDAGAEIRKISASTRIAVMTDSTVGPLHADALLASLRAAGFEVIHATIPAGEAHKNLSTVLPVFDAFLRAKIERTTPVIALGGGVVGDMAGFVAATVLRGVPFVQIPTTLLSMVDASVGGKTGVDHAVGKNLIGAFHQPKLVLIDPAVLMTLPARELRSGLAECIKHECIRDSAGFAELEKNIGRALGLELDYLTELIAHNVAIKARVVEADPFEKGERAHLNFGHTFGHAIESVSEFSYSHGESVALGMGAAAHLCLQLGMLTENDRAKIVALIGKAGLPTGGLKLSTDAVFNAMFFDKKVKSGKLRLILLDRIGHAVIRDDVPAERIRAAIDALR